MCEIAVKQIILKHAKQEAKPEYITSQYTVAAPMYTYNQTLYTEISIRKHLHTFVELFTLSL